jgi:hypothetical protein
MQSLDQVERIAARFGYQPEQPATAFITQILQHLGRRTAYQLRCDDAGAVAGGRHGVAAGLEDDRIDVLVAEMPTQGKPGDARTDDQHVGRQCQAQGDG